MNPKVSRCASFNAQREGFLPFPIPRYILVSKSTVSGQNIEDSGQSTLRTRWKVSLVISPARRRVRMQGGSVASWLIIIYRTSARILTLPSTKRGGVRAARASALIP